MRGIYGLLLAGGALLGPAASAEAQVTFSPGNPYTGAAPSITIGRPTTSYSYSNPQPGYAQPGLGYPQPGYAQPGYGPSGYAQPGYAQQGYAQPGYAQQGYAQPGYAQQGYRYAGSANGQPLFNRSDYARPASSPYANPGSSPTYYNSGYQGYSATGSPSYNQGYYGSTYVNPSQRYLSPTGGYPASNPYSQGVPSYYYLPR